jgi:predicted phosphodiesterase
VSKTLAFIHLSDIHFSSGTGRVFDLDSDLRRQLEKDVAEAPKVLGEIEGVLVTGDIAFAGTPEEYGHAKQWLKRVCGLLSLPDENVWCVPGNHDVDRRHLAQSRLLQLVHQDLENAPAATKDETLKKSLTDSHARTMLFDPFQGYNDFAHAFGCSTEAEAMSWSQDRVLNDGSTLRILGLNSALLSSSKDDIDDRRQLVGSYQIATVDDPAVVYMSLCHHPPDCFIDKDRVEPRLNTRVRLQLFGHKHRQQIVRIDDSLRIAAGAVHPPRSEQQWAPRYNWFCLNVSDTRSGRALEVTVWPRVWEEGRQVFVPDWNTCDGKAHKAYSLPLPKWERPSSPTPSGTPQDAARQVDDLAAAAIPTAAAPSPSLRTLAYAFLDRPHLQRIALLQATTLYEDQDEGLRDSELFPRAYDRALRRGLLPQFIERLLMEREY